MDRSPEIDNLEPLLQQLWCLFSREVTVNTSYGSFRRLIDVRLSDRLALVWTVIDLAWVMSANGYRSGVSW